MTEKTRVVPGPTSKSLPISTAVTTGFRPTPPVGMGSDRPGFSPVDVLLGRVRSRFMVRTGSYSHISETQTGPSTHPSPLERRGPGRGPSPAVICEFSPVSVPRPRVVEHSET